MKAAVLLNKDIKYKLKKEIKPPITLSQKLKLKPMHVKRTLVGKSSVKREGKSAN